MFHKNQEGNPQFIEGVGGWEIWQQPVDGGGYALGADPAEGLDPAESNNPDKTDRGIGDILDVKSKTVVAKLRCRLHEDEFAEQLILAGTYYNMAMVGAEVNNKCGGAVLSVLKKSEYANLYFSKRYNKLTDEWTEKVGWITDKLNRPMMLNDLRQLIRGSQPYYEPLVEIPSAETITELFSFVVDKDGKPAASPGEHDDEVMALAITIQIAMAAAGCMTLGDFVSDAAMNEPKPVPDDEKQTFIDRINVANAVDTFEDLEDDYE